ncbi:MAG: cytochrome c biogenesis protein ResB [Candidatus Marinimicrobia bacterium]|nr:cytochrome c biogenesis protein ResB [Candidatus Neomarinimicrobiota bacterium]MCK9559828.1 cytochrome c biogenesis protein ResB [Candidatus Neomarinimicrobiota bacterium]
MIKTYLRVFQIVVVVLIGALAISTLLVPEDSALIPILRVLSPDRFYASPLNIALWLTLCLVMLLAIFLKGMPGFAQKCLHFLLVMIFLLIIYDKTVNQRFYISIREEQEVNFTSFLEKPGAAYDIPIRLLKFDIQFHSGTNAPAAFTSQLLINQTDTALLAVNQPLDIGRYRLYQNAYDRDYFVKAISNQDTLITQFNMPFNLNQWEIVLREFNVTTGNFLVEVDKAEYQVAPDEISNLSGLKIKFDRPSPRYTSIIEVVEVTGVNILAILGLMYLLVLAYLLGWKQSNVQ